MFTIRPIDSPRFTDDHWEQYFAMLRELKRRYNATCTSRSAEELKRRTLAFLNSDPHRHESAILDGTTMLGWCSFGARNYGTPDQFDELRRPDEAYRAFFVMRDPRDLLVSWYFSNRHSHRATPTILERRRQLAEMTVTEGLANQLHTEFTLIGDTLTAWATRAEADPAVRLVRYEDLTGPDADDHWATLFDHCQIPIPTPVRRGVLATYAFKNLSGGREQSQEDTAAKYRKGTVGDWRNHFTRELDSQFEAVLPGLVERLGYGPW